MTPPATPAPKGRDRPRTWAFLGGVVLVLTGAVAVFTTDNEVGSGALVAAGVVVACLAALGNRVQAVEGGGIRVELQRQALAAATQAGVARAAGQPAKAEALEEQARTLLTAAGAIGTRYERLRRTEPAGWDRTARLEGVLREARDLDVGQAPAADVARLWAEGGDGDRVVALGLVEASPHLATADLLVDAVVDSRSSFEQYHALVATERAVDRLAPADRERVRAALEQVLAGPLGEQTSDRRTVARRVLERLTPGDG